MRSVLTAYPSLLRIAWAHMLQYRAEMVIWAIWGLVHPLIALAVWSAASGGRVIAGFDQREFAAYFLLLMMFGHLTMSWDAFEFGWLVQSGRLSPKLLRPIHPVHEPIAYNVSYKVMMLVVLAPLWAILFVYFRPWAPTRWWHIPAAVPALLLAAATRFLWNYCVAMIAFWTTKVDAIHQLYWSVDQFLGGRLGPLAVMPGFIRRIGAWAPFRYMTVFPVEIAMGRLTGAEVLVGLVVQVLWLGCGYLLFRVIWRLGIRQYAAVGT